MNYVMGIDPSINSTGIVILDFDTGEIVNFLLLNRKPQKYKNNPNVIYNGKFSNTEQGRLDRLKRFNYEFIKILEQYPSRLVFMEDYSFGSKSRACIHNAEIAGMLKLLLYNKNIPFMMVDPSTVKMMVNKGNSSKEEVRDSVKNIYNINFDSIDFDDGGNDLYDAYVLARMSFNYLKSKISQEYFNDLTKKEKNILTKKRKNLNNTSLLESKPVIKGEFL